MFAKRIITAAGHDSTLANYAAAKATAVDSRSALDEARQDLEQGTITAPIAGTVITDSVAVGSVIQSATGVYGGGATLMTIADLGHVRMNVNITESDMANIRIGETATISVDAFPGRVFNGVVEKIEPQAVVDQGVTFFPVNVSIENKERLLMPGMGGEVTIQAKHRANVLAVPADAVRGASELSSVARLFGMKMDSLTAALRPDLIPNPTSGAAAGHFVVVQLAPGKYEMREVQVGATDLTWYEITGGLKAGDLVVPISVAALDRPAITPTLQLAGNIRSGYVTQPAGAPRK
jgi:HlyD family secretion protein